MDWSRIADAARGIGAEDLNEEEKEQALLLRRVAEAAREQAEDFEVSRAKAIVPQSGSGAEVISRRPILAPALEGFGFRGVPVEARHLSFDFGHLGLDLRIEFLGRLEGYSLAGAIHAEGTEAMVIRVDGREFSCDEHGEFLLDVSSAPSELLIFDPARNISYRAEL